MENVSLKGWYRPTGPDGDKTQDIRKMEYVPLKGWYPRTRPDGVKPHKTIPNRHREKKNLKNAVNFTFSEIRVSHCVEWQINNDVSNDYNALTFMMYQP
jgi:hypothetical protein